MVACCVGMCAALLSSRGATIAWTAHDTTLGAAEVSAEGQLVYAYAPGVGSTGTTVNDVCFFGTTNLLGDVTASVTLGYDSGSFWTSGTSVPDGGEDYMKVLKGGFWANATQGTLTLRNLVAGKRYRVQLWYLDMRSGREGSTATLDGGACTLTMGSGAKTYGQYATGLFTADATTQAFTLSDNIQFHFNALQVRCLDDAKIAWTVYTTHDGSDILQAGRTHGAFVAGTAAVTVGGITFEPVAGGSTSFGTVLTVSPAVGSAYVGFFPTFPWYYPIDYTGVLTRGFWQTNGYARRRHLTLSGLTAGHPYAIQYWSADNRNTYSRCAFIDQNTKIAHNAGTPHGDGCYALGTFTAKSATQSFSMIHSSASLTGSEELFGAIQIRDLAETDLDGSVAWSRGATALDGSVDVRGCPVYAYSANGTEIAGTMFKAFGAGSAFGEDAEMSVSAYCASTPFVTGAAAAEMTPAVSNLLKGARWFYTSVASQFTLTLKHLSPGRRYLFQTWACDMRNSGRNQDVAGLVKVRYAATDAPFGEYATGVFRATNTTQTIAYTRANAEWELNAWQLRAFDLPNVAENENWIVSDTPGTASAVSSEGTCVYAYGAAQEAYAVNGTTFAVPDTLTNWNGDVTFSAPLDNRADCFYTSGADDEALTPLLKYAFWDNEATNCTVTLNRLTPGARYLVQFFICEQRADKTARTCPFKGQTIYYGLNGGKHILGSTVTGRFTASGTTYSFTVPFTAYLPQFNALQVRRLGFEGITWTGGASDAWTALGANWSRDGADCAGTEPWSAANGLTNNAILPAGTALALGSDVTAKNVISDGAVTIGTAGTEHTLTLVGEILAPQATVHAKLGSSLCVQAAEGEILYAGVSPAVRHVLVSAGTLGVAASDVFARPDVRVTAPGVLKLAQGVALPVGALAGDGTLAGPGRIALGDGANPCAVPEGFTYAGEFAWAVTTGTTLTFATAAAAADCPIYVADPEAYRRQPVATVSEPPVGKPRILCADPQAKAVWSKRFSGWILGQQGMFIYFR